MLIIDGHNLIPTIPGMSLEALDDEQQLLALLQLYARVRRKKIEVFFDGAPPGQAGVRAFGMVRAHFIRAGSTADEAIRQYLLGMKKAARNATVVTSDRQVQAESRALGASIIPSDEFARELLNMRAGLDYQAAKARGRRGSPLEQPGAKKQPAKKPPAQPGAELEQWYDLFGIDSQQAEKPIPLAPKKAARGQARQAGQPRHPEEPEQPVKSGTQDAQGAPKRKPRSGKPRKHHGFPKKKP